MTYSPVDHPRFKQIETRIFTSRIVADCMSHSCKDRGTDKLDACCQYGCDVDLYERDKILARQAQIAPLLRVNQPWFDTDEEPDPDTPSGRLVRTTLFENRCVFLAHDRRGCAIHRAALEQDWDMRGTKPHVCRLFPLSYTHDAIVISEEYEDYSCAHLPNAPTLYRWGRDTLADVFGAALVTALDRVESLTLPRHRLHLAPA
jgi:Fe-S-cluster containining protein